MWQLNNATLCFLTPILQEIQRLCLTIKSANTHIVLTYFIRIDDPICKLQK